MYPDALDEHLYLPGPTPVPPEIALAQALPMTDHRGARFTALARESGERLSRLFGTAGQVAILPASGTGGLEAAIANLFAPDDRLLAVVAGAFGARWADQAAALGFEVDRLEVPWGEAVHPDTVAEHLRGASYAGLLVTQNETSTGVLQAVRTIARRAREASPETLVLVDAVSGFPAVQLPMDAWGVDAVVCGSQKAFMLPPGLAFVALGARAAVAVRSEGRRRFYFDLRPYLDGHLPYTPAVGLWYALARALDRLEAEGEEARLGRHRLLADMARSGARALGLRPLAADDVASPTVTALRLPDGAEPGAVRAAAAAVGALLAGGMGPLASRAIRVGHVGHVRPLDVVGAMAALELALARVAGGLADGRASAAAVATWQDRLVGGDRLMQTETEGTRA